MKQLTEIEGNKLIAEVDECWPKYPNMDNTNKYSEWLFPHGHINAKAKDGRLCDMKYHTSWDWLMPAWKKFREHIVISEWWDDFADDEAKKLLQLLEISIEIVDIANAAKYLAQLITWLNNQNK